MTTTRMHTCIYFDDGGGEHLCPCGRRALLLVEEDGSEPVLVVLDEDVDATRPVPYTVVPRTPSGLAISA